METLIETCMAEYVFTGWGDVWVEGKFHANRTLKVCGDVRMDGCWED